MTKNVKCGIINLIWNVETLKDDQLFTNPLPQAWGFSNLCKNKLEKLEK